MILTYVCAALAAAPGERAKEDGGYEVSQPRQLLVELTRLFILPETFN
jgi:hypothetical protein